MTDGDLAARLSRLTRPLLPEMPEYFRAQDQLRRTVAGVDVAGIIRAATMPALQQSQASVLQQMMPSTRLALNAIAGQQQNLFRPYVESIAQYANPTTGLASSLLTQAMSHQTVLQAAQAPYAGVIESIVASVQPSFSLADLVAPSLSQLAASIVSAGLPAGLMSGAFPRVDLGQRDFARQVVGRGGFDAQLPGLSRAVGGGQVFDELVSSSMWGGVAAGSRAAVVPALRSVLEVAPEESAAELEATIELLAVTSPPSSVRAWRDLDLVLQEDPGLLEPAVDELRESSEQADEVVEVTAGELRRRWSLSPRASAKTAGGLVYVGAVAVVWEQALRHWELAPMWLALLTVSGQNAKTALWTPINALVDKRYPGEDEPPKVVER